jgi:phospholipid/cholesterol/gamma-HCH transport system substrate-binding protein
MLFSFAFENRNKIKMIKISKYTKLGFLVISCLAILIWGINYLKGIDLLKKSNEYFVVYDKVDGLLESSPVTINGYRVGQVTDIGFLEDNSGKILVTVSLNGNFKIGKGSIAKIVSSDIMGTKSIRLEVIKSTEYYAPEDTIPGSIEGDLKELVSMQVLPLKAKAEELIGSLDSALTIVKSVFNQQTQRNLTESFENINKTITNLNSISDELNKIMSSGKVNSIVTNLDNISGTFSKNSAQISSIIKNLSSLSDSLSKLNVSPVFDHISSSIAGLDSLIVKLNSKESSAGLLMNDPVLYENLTSLTSSLDLLLKDVRNNPKRYVHFTAMKMGKDVYVTAKPDAELTNNQILYKVHLISSPERLTIGTALFEGLGPIEEIKDGKTYKYLAGSDPDFYKVSQLLETARVKFPDANIVAFKKGKQIRLDHAIKDQSVK